MCNTQLNAFETSKKQRVLMNNGLQSMNQFVSTKIYIGQCQVQPSNQIDCLWFQGKERY